MLWPAYIGLFATALASASPLSLEEIVERYTKRTAGGIHLPIVQRETQASDLQKRGLTSAIGLGDFVDLRYNVLVSVGGTTTPLLLDTGSSDLWVISDQCLQGCTPGQIAYPQASFQYTGVDVKLVYGGSNTRSDASGMIGKDIVSLAGLTLPDQYFAAVNRTNTSLAAVGSFGIFGLGFPLLSEIAYDLYIRSEASIFTRREVAAEDISNPGFNVKYGSRILPSFDFRQLKFPNLSGFFDTLPADKQRRQTGSGVSPYMAHMLDSWSLFGPLLSRFVMSSQLSLPMFSITLQRDYLQVGGNVGELSIGELPSGVSNDSLTWVPIRAYPYGQGGLPAPTDSPKEVYPVTWEVPLDDVYLDGVKLPRSTLSPSSISLSANIDTGDPLIRGPADIVQQIQAKLGLHGLFPCSEPHTIEFSIGGKLFPVDPRDFIYQAFKSDVEMCGPLLAAGDPPSTTMGYKFSWSLGDPFLKSVFAAFYYGNVTYPSRDQPRVGFLSTVPPDAASQLVSAVAAIKSGDDFTAISEVAPTGTFTPAGTASNGVPEATAINPTLSASTG